jgi:pimeloyl-ACP methyl ester carboxylesterase
MLYDFRNESGGSLNSPLPYLPPIPALDKDVLRPVRKEIEGIGVVEGWVPTHYPRREMAEFAPAVVCVPGLGMCANSFARQLPLARYSELHCLQYPAFGMPGEHGLGHFAAYLETYIRAHGLENRPGGVVLLGTSMGGAVSMLTALRKNVKISGLMLVGTFASRKHLSFVQRNLAPFAWLMSRGLMMSIGRKQLFHTKVFGAFNYEEATYMLKCLNYHSNSSLYRAATGLTRLDLLKDIKAIETPTLVLHGTHDHVLPHAAGEEISKTIPNAEFVTVEKGGHALFFVEHEPTNQAMAKFLIQRAVAAKAAHESARLQVA